eukprot:12883689-Alexandrium_andersonii.AAC.1
MRDLRSAGLAAAPSVKTSPMGHLGPSSQPEGNWRLASSRSVRWTCVQGSGTMPLSTSAEHVGLPRFRATWS